ncbi:MAG TPA: heat-inducible transcriptional repressor HrcA [Actinomycetota bacterium]|jgi:heat-inducible transcriptional repressor|nr:heat-inducible transcriptional repressor HrcA [Actinomycetota bacterium]
MSLDDRKAQLLRAVVHDFIQQAKPVGSKTLADRYALDLSAATIRNELAALEEQGYLSHPHTSAGRVPTDLGYRFYVDSLSGVGKLARAQEEAIARYFEGAADLEETMRRTSVLLARLTQYTAMVAPPSLDRSRLRHIELVGLGRHVVMVVIIVDTGRVEKRLVESTFEVAADDLDELRRRFLDALVGERLDRAELVLGALGERVPPGRQALFDLLADAVGQMVSDQTSERVFIGGQAHLAGPDAFDGLETVHRVYEALEQQVLVLRLLRAVLDSDEQLSVTIGSENTVAGIEACSLVTSAYGTGDAAGSIGVIGPTRMDYLRAMAAVQAVARYLGDVLDDG